MSGDSSTKIAFAQRTKGVSKKMWKRMKVLELSFTTNVDLKRLEEFCIKNLKTKIRIFWCCPRAFKVFKASISVL